MQPIHCTGKRREYTCDLVIPYLTHQSYPKRKKLLKEKGAPVCSPVNFIGMSVGNIPKLCKKLIAVSISQNFREAVRIQSCPIPKPGMGELLVKNKYAGVNASDINLTAGRYHPGVQPPFDVGFEGMGKVVGVGENCGTFKPGDDVCYMKFGAFSQYILISAKTAIPVPNLDPRFIPLIVSGLTASISLEKVGQMRKGDKVLVTAAAGGTGQFAVQLAKLAGCHVIGTCSCEKKAQFLLDLGCDRPVNYKKEKLGDVLRKEYPAGVDVVYEGVGGEMFNTCVKNLAVGGRLIIIGFISSYTSSNFSSRPTIPLGQILLTKSASIRGFFLFHYQKEMPGHFGKLTSLLAGNQLVSQVDLCGGRGSNTLGGMEGVCDAVEFLYSGKSIGKIVVDLDPEDPSSLSKL